jgi:putative hemolysin
VVLYLELSIVAVLIIVNGLLAMSELAVVSSRPARLRALSGQGVRGADRALALSADPGRFLSTVQIGITLVGVLSGAVSGATLGLRLTQLLIASGVPDGYADALGVGTVVALITYASLIVGELVPKQIALRDAERVAARVAPAMAVLARVAAPLVFLLDLSGKAVLRLLGHGAPSAEAVTEEEVRAIMAEAEASGVIESDEHRIITGVMRLADRTVRGVMTPRIDTEWLDLGDGEAAVRAELLGARHAFLPVAEGDDDGMVGVLNVQAALASMVRGEQRPLKDFVIEAPIVHDGADALDVLPILRAAAVPMALVHDEYGHFEGIVTSNDLLQSIVGAFRADEPEPDAVEREDGSWLLSGSMPADEMADLLKASLPVRRDYETLAGFALARLGHFPELGESFDALGWRFEIVDLDGRRIDRLIARRQPSARGLRGMA